MCCRFDFKAATDSFLASRHSGFRERIFLPSRDCAETLHIVSSSAAGHIVLGTEEKDGCIRAERWQLSHNKNVIRHGLAAQVANNYPVSLSPHTTVAKLEVGIPVEP
jgi:hypothetical protein